ncbi:MAG TPA: dipeptide/oligopeptide/nickel ABC transporter ATP-binding protein [Acidobacteriota bacterium]
MAIRFRLRVVGKTFRNRRLGREAAVPALAAVDLDIHERQANALVGRSGAGKSTLARIVMGFEAPDSGEVLYRGRPLSAAPRPDFCRRNQMVFQNPYLAVNPVFSVQQIIAEPLRILKIPDEGAAGAGALSASEKIAEVLDMLELPGAYLQRLPHELSGGELQRVALARALVLEPEFLVLDEPFSALDDLTAMRILLQFKRIFLRLRLGILFVSHHPRHVLALADRVAVLEQGKIVG